MTFTFDDDMIDTALRANGWHDLWHPDNWVHESATNPDWAGTSKKNAFEQLLYKSNIFPKDVDKCWSK